VSRTELHLENKALALTVRNPFHAGAKALSILSGTTQVVT